MASYGVIAEKAELKMLKSVLEGAVEHCQADYKEACGKWATIRPAQVRFFEKELREAQMMLEMVTEWCDGLK